NSILSPLSRLRRENIMSYQPLIKLVAMSDALKINILFVGHPICESLHVKIYQDVSSCFEVGFYYKPHPANPCTDSVRAQKWHVIEEKSTFPLVDFVVSYPSTLVGEYAAMGIPAVLHPLDLKVEQHESFTFTIKDKLKNLACEKKRTQ
ncbi:hypothetical protein, partial [Pseudomonas cichorii]|uniref:hypothetical protein n=1 Tax=Pseudomonas cichorii TaxID=36746 RepID=UPI001E4457F9